ncbi:MAG: acetate kinase [Eubacteriales bacterium]|nr:acetate kinase [Eubacteriales bacterium]
MEVLVINCGSSSLKFQFIDSVKEEVLAKGLCERIGIDGGRLVYQREGYDKITTEKQMADHTVAVKMVLEALQDEENGVIKDIHEVEAVGHRVVHGGEKFSSSIVIDDEVLKGIEACNDLAPLHNPANLIGINACRALMPGVPMVAVFDTAFHQTMPQKAYLYGIPYALYEKYGIRRYGFHGTSHSYVSRKAAEFFGFKPEASKVVVCHLGNGSSICAVKNGKSVDTSMGFTPLAGVLMGTRSGDIDPAIVDFLYHKGMTIEEIHSLLNKESGVLGLSGYSSDFRDIEDGVAEGREEAIRALDVFCYGVAKYIAGYAAAMGGVDVIAFTAGVGENDTGVRERVCEYLTFMGVKFDAAANNVRGKAAKISTDDSTVQVCVMPTNEELVIALDTLALVQ